MKKRVILIYKSLARIFGYEKHVYLERPVGVNFKPAVPLELNEDSPRRMSTPVLKASEARPVSPAALFALTSGFLEAASTFL